MMPRHKTLLAKIIRIQLICVLIVFSICTSVCFAEEQSNEIDTDVDKVTSLPIVTVEAPRIAPTTGTVILDKEIIDTLPTRNGSINELLGITPTVQYSEEYNSSISGGEIFPPGISISGSRPYDNNYTIDGLGNTSILNPGNSAYNNAYTLPGYPQKQFLNPRLIEEITVYNTNIPAEFGGFTGGQVNATTLDPAPEFWGQLSYRTTSDRWTQFHIDPIDKEEFYAADETQYQPVFTKQDFGLILNAPLNRNTSFLTAYQKALSQIRLNHIDGQKTNVREKENLLLKAKHYFSNSSQITLTGLYSPTHASYARTNHRNSDYTIDQTNYSLNLQIKKDFHLGELSLQTGYSEQKTERKAPTDQFIWDKGDEDPDRDGGSGDLRYTEDEIIAKATFSLNPLDLKTTNHRIASGVEVGHARTSYYRPNDSLTYSTANVNTETICSEDDPACREGDRYLTRLTVYNQAHESETSNQLKLFLQDSIAWKRLEVFPGLRMNYDSLVDDINLAPRFSSSLDIFGNGLTILFAGRNRYYSDTLLEQGQHSYTRYTRETSEDGSNLPTEWTVASQVNFKTSDIKAPYTDETTAGVIQKILGSTIKVQYIKKKSRDEFARTKTEYEATVADITYDIDTYSLNNNGRSEYESILLNWQTSWNQHYLEINGTWQASSTSNTSYTTEFYDEDLTETYWYEDTEYYKFEKPKTDFCRPTIINFIYSWRMSDAISFTSTVKYRGKYWTLIYEGRKESILNPNQARTPIVYKKAKAKSAITFDWSINWRIFEFKDYEIVANIDILNVFNKKNRWGYQSGKFGYDYEIGRQFWLGVDVNF